MTERTATVLVLSQEVREAAKDAESIKRKLREEGHAWAPALTEARRRMIELAHAKN